MVSRILKRQGLIILIASICGVGPMAYGQSQCAAETQKADVVCGAPNALKQTIAELKGKINSVKAGSGAQKTIEDLKSQLESAEKGLKDTATQCSESLSACKAACDSEIPILNSNIAQLEVALQGTPVTPATSTARVMMQTSIVEKKGLLASAEAKKIKCEGLKEEKLAKLWSGIKSIGGGLLTLAQVAQAIGLDLFGDKDGKPPTLEETEYCDTPVGALSVACGNHSQVSASSAGGGLGSTDGSYSPLSAGNSDVEVASDDQEGLGANEDNSDPFAASGGAALAGGFEGGSAGSDSSGDNGKTKGKEKGPNADIYKGFHAAGSGSGSFGGRSGGKGLSFRRMKSLEKKLASAKTAKEKKKILAQFKKANGIRRPARGLASTGKDGKAGPFQDNFAVVKRSNQRFYKTLFQK